MIILMIVFSILIALLYGYIIHTIGYLKGYVDSSTVSTKSITDYIRENNNV